MTGRTLKIAKGPEVSTASIPSQPDLGALHEGDTIEIGISSEVRIDGDKTWVSYKVQTKVGSGESAEQAHHRAVQFTKNRFKTTVYETVDMVQGMGE